MSVDSECMLEGSLCPARSTEQLHSALCEAWSPTDRDRARHRHLCAGSTELWEWDNVSMDEANALHDKIMRGHLREFFGFEVCTEGDAFLLAFHDPVDAVKWCIRVQQVRGSLASFMFQIKW